MEAGTKVVVCTNKDRRGVFCGELVDSDIEKGTCTLANARMCVYWSKETRGVQGLASIGPQKDSRITPCIPRQELNGVTTIMHCTDTAWSLWEAEPWN